jgi:hypothetical protein
MKRLILTAGLALAAVSGFSQGTIDFKNTAIVSGSTVVNAPVTGPDGLRVIGTSFRAALYAGAAGTAADQLRMIGSFASFVTQTTGAGFFLGGTRTLNENGVTVLPGASATIQVRAWAVASGATWEAATIRGQSPLLTIATGGTGVPAGPPALMAGLQAFQIVPEPSTIALGILGGLGTLFLVRRRK